MVARPRDRFHKVLQCNRPPQHPKCVVGIMCDQTGSDVHREFVGPWSSTQCSVHVKTVDVREVEVEDDRVRRFILDDPEGGPPISRGCNGESG